MYMNLKPRYPFRFTERRRSNREGPTSPDTKRVVSGDSSPTTPTPGISGSPSGPTPVKNKLFEVSRMEQLRAEHQKQHRDRHGLYPLEDEEEIIERQIREYEAQHCVNHLTYLKEIIPAEKLQKPRLPRRIYIVSATFPC